MDEEMMMEHRLWPWLDAEDPCDEPDACDDLAIVDNPDACRECGGTGWVTFLENGAPHGCGYWPMPVTEGCEACLGVGRCPVCGAEIDQVDEPPFLCQNGHESDDDGYFSV